jgi:hypothetical protein
MVTYRSVLASLLLSALAGTAVAEPAAPPAAPTAATGTQTEATPGADIEIAVHAGLTQPVLFHGVNAAIDLRWRRLVVSYSHGQWLDYSQQPSLTLTRAEADAGLSLRSPWTTGFGIGARIVDELYLLADVKVHRYDARVGDETAHYTTASLGAEIGWRWFAWRGAFIQPVVRFWPNVYSSLPGDQVMLGSVMHRSKDLGLFANVTVGWAFGR